ncbi:MAG: amidophosphoribosyltransferase [SAR324 cluster bacterium]|uniref:Amidophosphoribosyltransferase n=1 Tax=SAR324 cluster bacterium TaxID=2024889 RepID=A0A7X9IKT7_9DELT|nr:amidophosphoribosyltransferase [SAR324 cluster bacterium]
MFDKFKDECGLIGVWNHKEAANIAYLGLYGQQHRGQEGAGVVALDRKGGASFSAHKGLGLVSDVFTDFKFSKLPGDCAIGHVRYTTAGGNKLSNVQPFLSEISCGTVAIAHNGNLINADSLRRELISDGAIFGSTSDTEVILHLLARGRRNEVLTETIIDALKTIKGTFSLLMLFNDRLVAVRDPNGFRPLCIGRLNGSIVIASETCALDLLGADYVRDIGPGELVEIVDENTIKSYFPFGMVKETPCVFEFVYFARPDSYIFERNVYPVRIKMGIELAKEHPADADIVIPVPDSGLTAAIGYSRESEIPLELGLIRNHYVGRTFIEPLQSIRNFGVRIKLNPNKEVIEGKRVVVIDDSIVRGTTSKKIINMIRKAGAKEIHLRISSPPTTDPCFYGVDTPSKEELIASYLDVEGIRDFVGADSLGYLSLEGLYKAVESKEGKLCDACFSGCYPIGKPSMFTGKKQLDFFEREN